MDWFYDISKHEIQMQSLDWRIQHGVVMFFDNLLTFAIDGSEQEIQQPGENTHLDTYFFSGKKEMHSINIILIVALDSTILYLSDSHGGSCNDEWIVKKEGDKWVVYLHEHEGGAGDNGFNGLREYHIFTPPSNRNEMYAAFAGHHIIVKNVIADIKDFEGCSHKLLLKVDMSKKILKQHNKGWTIAFVFVNKY